MYRIKLVYGSTELINKPKKKNSVNYVNFNGWMKKKFIQNGIAQHEKWWFINCWYSVLVKYCINSNNDWAEVEL